MKQKLFFISSLFILITAIYLRFTHIAARAPFDWDQNRDYKVISEIASGKPTLIGPVAKGEGGFFLGPLYYYLVTPVFLISSGNPIALPLTSATLDVITIVMILLLFPRIWSRRATVVLAGIWTVSFFAIEMSKISWNVALLPLYSILLIYYSLLSIRSRRSNLIFGLLLGLSWHIHASLIPLIPLLVLYILHLRRLKLTDLPFIILGYIIALSPLILFDLRHNFLNLRLLTSFVKVSSASEVDIITLFTSVFSRFGKNIFSTLFATSNLHLGVGIGASIFCFLTLLRGSTAAKLAGGIILLNLILVLALREAGFPEYYLGISYLPILIVLLDFFEHFPRTAPSSLIILFILCLVNNYRSFTISSTSFSLGQKQTIVQAIAAKGATVDLCYDLPFGRESGFELLLPRSGVQLDSNSPNKVIVSEKMGERLFIDGELTEDLGYFGGMHVGIRVVQ